MTLVTSDTLFVNLQKSKVPSLEDFKKQGNCNNQKEGPFQHKKNEIMASCLSHFVIQLFSVFKRKNVASLLPISF